MKIKGLFQKRDWWHYWPPQVDGVRPKRIPLRTKDRDTAIKMVLDLQAREFRHMSSGRLSGEIERFMAAKEAEGAYTRKTAQVTRNALELFCSWADNPLVVDVSPKTIEDWKIDMVADGRATSGIVTYLRRVQALFSWMVKKERLATNPFDRVDIPARKKRGAVTFATRKQRDQLVENCQREDLRFVLMAGFFLGLRKIEIIEARPEWFRTPGVVEVAQTSTFLPKDKERRLVHYGDRFADFLKGYGLREPFMLRPEKRQGRSLYRYDFRRPWTDYVREQGMAWMTAHVMRHTFATLHIQAGTPLPMVADWLGDSYEVTHRHYAAYAPLDAHIRNLD